MLFIGTPLYDNKVSSEYLDGLMKTTYILNKNGLSLEYAFERGTYIGVNRERLVRRFLRTNNQIFLFIDADMAFTELHVLSLLSSNEEIISGLYRYRTEVADDVSNHCFHGLDGKPIDVNGPELQECAFLPTGILMIQRSVFEKLYTKHKFLFDQGFKDKPAFDIELENGNIGEDDIWKFFEGEDIHFSRICREEGLKLKVKTSVRVDHLGEKHWKVT